MSLVVNPICLVLPFLSFCLDYRNQPTTRPPANAPVDAFKALGNLPKLVTAYTVSTCSNYNCMNATRTRYNNQTKEVSYVWYLQGPPTLLRKSATFDIKFGSTLDTASYTIDGDMCHTYQVSYEYSDYKSCIVLGFTYYLDKVCFLLVEESVLNNIPKSCIDGFNKACDAKNATSSLNSC
ncbi:uncharacterized protein LOC144144938 [Haemaphysalis longicornis]